MQSQHAGRWENTSDVRLYSRSTELLSQRCARVVGIEISSELVEASRAAYPGLQFECMDAIRDGDRLKEVWRQTQIMAAIG
jgi:hypothetical protein